MKRMKNRLFILSLATIIPIITSSCSQPTDTGISPYYPEGLEFYCFITNDTGGQYDIWYDNDTISLIKPYIKSDGFIFSAKFLSLSDSCPYINMPDKYLNTIFTYRLHVLGPDDTIKLSLIGAFDTIHFAHDTTYDFYGIPAYGGIVGENGHLSVFKHDSLLFEGNGSSLFDTIKHPINFELDSILTVFSKTSDGLIYTNEQYIFYDYADTIKLIQGQVGELGNYNIYLGVARSIRSENCYVDPWPTGMSYSIWKTN